MNAQLTLVSHLLCPYVQRAVILLTEKQIPFERIDVDLSNKPDWFLKVSPLGKTPVLLVDGQPSLNPPSFASIWTRLPSRECIPSIRLSARATGPGWNFRRRRSVR